LTQKPWLIKSQWCKSSSSETDRFQFRNWNRRISKSSFTTGTGSREILELLHYWPWINREIELNRQFAIVV